MRRFDLDHSMNSSSRQTNQLVLRSEIDIP